MWQTGGGIRTGWCCKRRELRLINPEHENDATTDMRQVTREILRHKCAKMQFEFCMTLYYAEGYHNFETLSFL